MANFFKAYKKLEVAEGGYVNDKDDLGGETYKGISRKHNPNWIGWCIIDDLKKHHPNTFASIAKKTPHLEKAVQELYKKNYWDTFRLDDFNSQKVAEEIFDMHVNAGKVATIKLIYKALGIDEKSHLTDDILDKISAIS